ncbi:MAG TPA: ATP-binding protein [Rhodothermales bacterium]|nr:ATP-binding protein [Rhodothermales bacterium]
MKRFRFQCSTRVVLIGVTMLVAIFLAYRTASYMAAGLVALAAVSQLYALIMYVERTNRDLGRFLRSIQYSDFSQAFTSGGRGERFAELSSAFSAVMDEFRAERSEKEESYRYLLTVVQHIGIGLLSFKQDGEVGLINAAAKRLLRVTHLRNIRALSDHNRELAGILLQLRSGEKALVQVVDDDDLLQLSIYATEFKMRGDLYTLVSIQNIQSELEEKEIESWQKLTRVLTHEIMNSITPIASLASTANELLMDIGEPAGDGAVVTEALADVRNAVRTIERRSQNLLGFVHAYRSLTRIPKPDFRIFRIADLFGDVALLMQPQMEARGIRFTRSIEPDQLDLTADPELIEQVLINLLKNAMEAAEGIPDAAVTLSAHIDERGRTVLQVADNGPGIVQEAIDKIFIPFFTTKKEGSGIGLSLSRQIMRQHGGTLSAVSEPDNRTVFTLRF